MKPRPEWGVRLVEDSASGRGYMRATELTRINLTANDAIVSSNSLAFLTEGTFWPARILEEFEAGIISRELSLKVFDSVGFHLFSPISIYTYTIAQNIRVVKG
jgi:hypothetical protein